MSLLILKLARKKNASHLNQYLETVAESFKDKREKVCLLAPPQDSLLDKFSKLNLPNKRTVFSQQPTSLIKSALFWLFFPWYVIKISYYLLYFKIKYQCNSLFCVYIGEKLLATLPARLLGYKVFWLEHTLPERVFKKKLIFGFYKLLARFGKIVTVSSYIKDYLLAQKIKAKDITVIAPGVPQSRINKKNIENDTKFIIGTIAGDNHAGLHVLLKAAALCREFIFNWQLVVVEADKGNNLAWAAKLLGIDNNVRIITLTSELSQWMERFSVFIMPDTHQEALDFYFLTALAQGTPVIAPFFTGISELVEQNKTGYIVKPNDPEMLSQAILDLYHDKETRALMGTNARRHINEHFSLTKMKNKYYQLFEI